MENYKREIIHLLVPRHPNAGTAGAARDDFSPAVLQQ